MVTYCAHLQAKLKYSTRIVQLRCEVPDIFRAPVRYHLDIHRQNELCFKGKKDPGSWEGMYDIEQKPFTGFIAQEVAAAARAVGYDFSGVEQAADEVGLYSVRYSDFVAPLVKAVQEQQTEIEQLHTENAALKAQLDTQGALLSKLVAAVEARGIAVD